MRTLSLITILVGVLAVAHISEAQDADAPAPKSGADPTDFITRYEPSYEYRSLENGADAQLFVMRTDLALTPKLSLRLDIPYADIDLESQGSSTGLGRIILRTFYDRNSPLQRLSPFDGRVGGRLARRVLGTGRGGFRGNLPVAGAARSNPFSLEDENGLGDIVTAINWKFYSGEKTAAIASLRVDWDTASEGILGRGGNVVAPMVAFAWYPNRKLIIAPVFQWYIGNNLDNDPLPGERDMNLLSYRQIVLYQPMKPYMSWLMLDPEFLIDFENNTESLNIAVEYGKVIGKKKNKAVFVKPIVGVGGDNGTDWGVKIGFRHMFPGLKVFGD